LIIAPAGRGRINLTTPCIKSARSHASIRLRDLQSQQISSVCTAFFGEIDGSIVALFVLLVMRPLLRDKQPKKRQGRLFDGSRQHSLSCLGGYAPATNSNNVFGSWLDKAGEKEGKREKAMPMPFFGKL
jgi:hypothetical protein